MRDDREARLRRQVAASRHDPSISEASMAWAVDEIDSLRARVAELEAGEFTTEWAVRDLSPVSFIETWIPVDSKADARRMFRRRDVPAVARREVRTGPWVDADPSGEET
jgi:hypothetical protein